MTKKTPRQEQKKTSAKSSELNSTTPVLTALYLPNFTQRRTCHRNCPSNITKQSDTATWSNIAPGTTPVLTILYLPNFMTKYCAWHYSSTSTPVLPCISEISPNAAPATEIVPPTSPTMRLPTKVTLQHDQILRLPRKVTPQQFLRSQATKHFGHKRPKIAVTSDPPPNCRPQNLPPPQKACSDLFIELGCSKP